MSNGIENLNISDLLPPPLNLMPPKTDDQFINWGAKTIAFVVKHHEKRLAQCKSKINEEQSIKSKFDSDRSQHKRAAVKIKKLTEEKDEIESVIESLDVFYQRAQNLEGGQIKPVLPICRPLNWFESGEKVKFFDGDKWIEIEIDLGRDPNGISGSIIVESREIPRRSPRVMKLSELEFLKNNLAFAKLWASTALLFNKGFDTEIMIQAIKDAK